MASGSKQLKASPLLVAGLLLLVCTCTTRGKAARPEPGSKDGHMPATQRAVSAAGVAADHEKEKSGSATGGVEDEPPEEIRECEGGAGDEREECLMRRTLVAHTDYIYTQGKHN